MNPLDLVTAICIMANTFMVVFSMNKITIKSGRHFAAGFNLFACILNSAIMVGKYGLIGLPIVVICIAAGLFIYYRTNGV